MDHNLLSFHIYANTKDYVDIINTIVPVDIHNLSNYIIYGIDVSVLLYHHLTENINKDDKISSPNFVCHINVYINDKKDIIDTIDKLEYNSPVYVSFDHDTVIIYPLKDDDSIFKCITEIHFMYDNTIYDDTISNNINISLGNSLVYVDKNYIYFHHLLISQIEHGYIKEKYISDMDIIDVYEYTFYNFLNINIENIKDKDDNISICEYINKHFSNKYIVVIDGDISACHTRFILECTYKLISDYAKKYKIIYHKYNFLQIYNQIQNRYISKYIKYSVTAY